MATTPITVQNILEATNNFASFSLAANWDNVGLLAGDPAMESTGILLALDPTSALLDEALEKKANVIITHHPIIFHPLKHMRSDQPQGRFLTRALKNDIAVIGCHSNLDLASGGVNDALAGDLGLDDIRPLPSADSEPSDGPSFGRIGRLIPPLTGQAFLQHTMHVLHTPVLRVAGPVPATINLVAVCGGSGGDLADAAFRAGSNIFLTAEVKHSIARWAEEAGHCIVDGGHFPTENIVLPKLAAALRREFIATADVPPIFITSTQEDAFTYFNQDSYLPIGDTGSLRQP